MPNCRAATTNPGSRHRHGTGTALQTMAATRAAGRRRVRRRRRRSWIAAVAATAAACAAPDAEAFTFVPPPIPPRLQPSLRRCRSSSGVAQCFSPLPISTPSLTTSTPPSFRHRRRRDGEGASTSSNTALGIAKSGGREITTSEDFDSSVLVEDEKRQPVLVFFSAPWCGPCRLSNPVVKAIMKEFAGRIDVVEVCTDDLPDVAADAGVVSIPTIQLYYGGEVRDTIVGCVAKNVLATAVNKVLEDTAEE